MEDKTKEIREKIVESLLDSQYCTDSLNLDKLVSPFISSRTPVELTISRKIIFKAINELVDEEVLNPITKKVGEDRNPLTYRFVPRMARLREYY